MFTVEKEKERKKDFKGILIHSEWNKGREKDLKNRSVGTAGCCRRRRRRKREAFGHGRDDMKRKWKRGEMMVHMANGLFRLYWRQILNLETYQLSTYMTEIFYDKRMKHQLPGFNPIGCEVISSITVTMINFSEPNND